MLKSNNEETKHFYDSLISDFTDPLFVKAFQKYFAELGIEVKDWDGVFIRACAYGELSTCLFMV